MKASKEFIKALNRVKGELRLSDSQIAKQTGLSIVTVNKLLNGNRSVVQDKTFYTLSNWLFEKI